MSRFSVRDIFVLLAAMAALLIPIIVTEVHVLQRTKGLITYPADDAYINLTVARNLAFDKVWGITKESFQSVTVTPLYVIILALVYFIFGQDLFIPLLINELLAFVFIIIVQRWMVRRHIGILAQLILLALIIFCGSLPSLVISGKEYVLQVLLTFIFVSFFAESLSKVPKGPWVYLFGGLMVLSGYNCSVLAALACAVLCRRQQWTAALLLALSSFIPLILLGLLSIKKGGYFLPNPLLMPTEHFIHAWSFIIANVVFFGGVFIQKFCSTLPTGRNIIKWGAALILVLLLTPIYLHSANMLRDSSTGCLDIYDHEYPVAKFIHRYFSHSAIVLNEAGMISYWFQGRSLDLTGKTNHEALACRRIDLWSANVIDSLSRNSAMRIAILSNNRSELPAKWSRVAEWGLSREGNGSNSIDFFIVDTSIARYLRKNLEEFQPSLPLGTVVHYFSVSNTYQTP